MISSRSGFMGNVVNPLLIIIVIVLAMEQHAFCISNKHQKPDRLDEWAQNILNKQEKVTHLHFYFHDLINVTAYEVTRSPISGANPYMFGLTYMIDDPLTQTPDSRSKPVGRAYGFYGLTSMHEFALFNMMGFLFTQGKYNGSSVSLLSYNPTMHPERDLAIVGGTGAFRLARGVARARTFFLNITAARVIIEYDFYIIHY